MRFAFLDEGGISKKEPYIVVGGIVVEADRQLLALERELENLVRKHIPEDKRQGFVFHATDIWSGVKFFRDRQAWPLEKRISILRDLADLPREAGHDDGYRRAEARYARSLRERVGYMIRGIPPRLLGRVVAHVAGGKTLIRIEEQRILSWLISSDADGQTLHQPDDGREPVYAKASEGWFPTDVLPPECRALGSQVWVTLHPHTAVPFLEISN